jgi:glyoxylase-like metal-dependent hydrolase (beta-lactamase superfamily II)
MQEIAPGVAVVPTQMANAYLVGNGQSWVLVDACTPGHEGLIRRAAARRFGGGSRPRAILLTHGHFDHAGSAAALADTWKVPIYAHPLEIPYLTRQDRYPAMNLKVPGFFSLLARFLPVSTTDLGARVRPLEPGRPLPELQDWEMIETPGHTPGHVCFFRRRDGVLVAGDAVTTMNLDSFWATVTKRRQVCKHPVQASMDCVVAGRSVGLLAELKPAWIAAGHGAPMRAGVDDLERLAGTLQAPSRRSAGA